MTSPWIGGAILLVVICVYGCVWMVRFLLRRRYFSKAGNPITEEEWREEVAVQKTVYRIVHRVSQSRWNGPTGPGDVFEQPDVPQDTPNAVKRSFYVFGENGKVALRLHTWAIKEEIQTVIGFQVETGIDSGILLNWTKGQNAGFSIMRWRESTGNLPSSAIVEGPSQNWAIGPCLEVLRQSKLDENIRSQVVDVLNKKLPGR